MTKVGMSHCHDCVPRGRFGSYYNRYARKILLIFLPIMLMASQPACADEKLGAKLGAVTKLQLPRFVSLKADEVNARVGPGADYAITWVFHRPGLPVEILAEFENWRQVRDSEGGTGWVAAPLL